MSIALYNYSTSGFRKLRGLAPDLTLSTVAEGTFGDLYCRTEETNPTTSNISTGAAAANIVDSFDYAGLQMGSAAVTDTSIVAFQDLSGVVKILEYTGDGVDPQAITGVGFQPDVVMAFEPGTAKFFIKTKDHAGDNCRDMSGNTGPNNADAIDSLDADGFTVASAVNLNTNATKYVSLCLKEATGFIKVLSYAGDGAGARALTGVGFSPGFIMFIRTDAVAQVLGLRLATMIDGEALDINQGLKVGTNTVDSLDSDGWTFLGTGAWNVAAATYSAVCIGV
jgi:hypothetical protein